MNKVFIYGLYKDGTDNIRYIGKTNKKDLQKRLNEHLCESFREKEITHKRNWIKSIINNNGAINIKCIEEVNEENWKEREIYWISQFSNLTNTTDGGESGHGIIYDISYENCKIYVQKELKIKSKSEWYKKIKNIPYNIPKYPRETYLNRGWKSWGDFLGTGRIQDNIKSEKYISCDESKKWIKNNLNINNYFEWKQHTKENKIPDFIPNRPDRYYKKRGWLSWGDFLSTDRIANQYKKNIFLSYNDAQKFIIENNIKSISQFRKFKLPINIPTAPHKYYIEWISWGEFFKTKKLQDNLLSENYLSYNDAKDWIKTNLIIKSEKIWKENVKNSKIPNTIPNHPELYYNRKNRGWIGWKDFLFK